MQLYIAKGAAKNEEIAKKVVKRITSLTTDIRGQLQFLETVDLTNEEERDSEPPNKRARIEEDTPKSALAIQHESTKEAIKVKEGNINNYVSFLQSTIGDLASVAQRGQLSFDEFRVAEFMSATAMANMR